MGLVLTFLILFSQSVSSPVFLSSPRVTFSPKNALDAFSPFSWTCYIVSPPADLRLALAEKNQFLLGSVFSLPGAISKALF